MGRNASLADQLVEWNEVRCCDGTGKGWPFDSEQPNPLQMTADRSTQPKTPHHVFIRSDALSIDTTWEVITLLDALTTGKDQEIVESVRFLNREQVVGTTNAFCGACLQPISLEHFSDDSAGDIVFVRNSKWRNTPSELVLARSANHPSNQRHSFESVCSDQQKRQADCDRSRH